jgi:hypothetical protein
LFSCFFSSFLWPLFAFAKPGSLFPLFALSYKRPSFNNCCVQELQPEPT